MLVWKKKKKTISSGFLISAKAVQKAVGRGKILPKDFSTLRRKAKFEIQKKSKTLYNIYTSIMLFLQIRKNYY